MIMLKQARTNQKKERYRKMTNNRFTEEQCERLIHDMNEFIEIYGKNPHSESMKLIKTMYLEDRITIDEFMILIK